MKIAGSLGPDFDYLGGGTDLLQNYKCQINVKKNVISLRHISPIQRISGDRIGGGALLGELAGHKAVRRYFPAMTQTAGVVASPLIINTATLGGNLLQDTRCYHFNQTKWWRVAHGSCLKAEANICRVVPNPGNICYATYCGDIAPLLICLDASATLFGPQGEREVKADAFFQMDGIKRFVKTKEEILAWVNLPDSSRTLRAAYQKLRLRQSIDYPEIGIAAALELEGDRVKRLRIAATALAPVPVIYDEVTNAAVGQRWNEDLIRALSAKVMAASSPYRNTYLVPQYRKKMAGVLSRRVLRQLGEQQALVGARA